MFLRGTGFSFIGFEMKRRRRIFIGFDFNLDIYGTIRVFFFFFSFFFLWSLKNNLRTINVQEIFFRFFER